jgi:hypothetical protein
MKVSHCLGCLCLAIELTLAQFTYATTPLPDCEYVDAGMATVATTVTKTTKPPTFVFTTDRDAFIAAAPELQERGLLSKGPFINALNVAPNTLAMRSVLGWWASISLVRTKPIPSWIR